MLSQCVEQPAARWSEHTVSTMCRIDDERAAGCLVIFDLEGDQFALGKRCGDEMLGHAAPAETGVQEVEPSA